MSYESGTGFFKSIRWMLASIRMFLENPKSCDSMTEASEGREVTLEQRDSSDISCVKF